MDVRWMPVLAAAIGVLGGVGGALVGSFAANEGQEAGFKRERAAAERDLRREAYGTYVGTAQEVWATYLANVDELQGDESAAAKDKIDAAAVRLFVAEAHVRLVAENDEVEVAAGRLREVLVDGDGEDYSDGEEQEAALEEATKDFLAVAKEDTEE
jgi:hypothetical protein